MKYALLIGINYIGTPNELHGCHQDVDDVYAYLSTKGYKMTVLKDADHPTRENIILNIKKIVSQCKPEDTLVFWYSGHGTYIKGNERDGRDECLCATDGIITDNELRPLFRGCKIRAVFDACHSGSILDLPLLYNKYIERENNTPGTGNIISISGCRDNQTSADAVFIHPNGALTYHLLKALKKGPYDWRDLMDKVRLNLKKDGFNQIPQLGMTNNYLYQLVDF